MGRLDRHLLFEVAKQRKSTRKEVQTIAINGGGGNVDVGISQPDEFKGDVNLIQSRAFQAELHWNSSRLADECIPDSIGQVYGKLHLRARLEISLQSR